MIPLVPYTHRGSRYTIVHRQSNKLLTSDSSSTTNPSPGVLIGAVNLNNRNVGSNQQWTITSASSSGSYSTIQSYATGLYLDGDGTVKLQQEL